MGMLMLHLLRERGIHPRKKAGTHGGEYSSSCPVCGGKDRFLCWPEQGEGTWYCRGCDKAGDPIEFLRHVDGLSFGEACKRLGIERRMERHSPRLPKTREPAPEPFTPREFPSPAPLWREKAAALLDYAHGRLLADAAWMRRLAERGIDAATVGRYRLGLLPGEKGRDCHFRPRAAWGLPEVKGEDGKAKPLWIPAGLVIPAFDADGVCRLRVRRTDAARESYRPEMKYVVVSGSCMRPLLLRPESRAFVVVESELDAIACAAATEAAGLDCGALAVGTNLGRPDAAAHASLSASLCILAALDFDPPGKDGKRPGAQGMRRWTDTYRQARPWLVSRGKDPGEAFALGVDLAKWIEGGLPPVMTLASVPASASMSKGGTGASSPGLPEDDAAWDKTAFDLLPDAATPADCLTVLARAGLWAVKEFDGYVICGDEKWNKEDYAALRAWVKKHGTLVRAALWEGIQG
jgi:hypothetical protein